MTPTPALLLQRKARRIRRGAWWAVACALLWLDTANAAPVTVTLTAASGASAQDALVILDPLNAAPPPSSDTASIDQLDKHFVPRVSVLRTGTTVSFPNSDHIRHQVYSFSAAKVFTLKLYAGSPSAPITFDKPGLVVLGCNIHDRMLAFVGVVDTPYFAKADASGSAVVNVPAGRYRLRVWHPALSATVPAQEITVEKTALAIPLNVNIDGAASAVAAWPE
jgi:plastocyanin